MDLSFFDNKSILITGHTGFKGSWLCNVLLCSNANISGFALNPPTQPNLFEITGLEKKINSVIGDIRDYKKIFETFQKVEPDIVIHMAAQPIVLESYKNPIYTYETNVLGTVNILECVRETKSVKSFVNVTTDKVYKNYEWEWGYRENDELDGFDPYSNSKSCSELISGCYKRSFFMDTNTNLSTARAGNVIGGGDFAKNRIIPDCIRAVMDNQPIIIRNPHSIRPYQHVLESLSAYLLIVEQQYGNSVCSGNYNIGPDHQDCIKTEDLVKLFCELWGDNSTWKSFEKVDNPHEANFLRLDNSRIRNLLGWKPKWSIEKALHETINWTKDYINGKDVDERIQKQIREYFES